MRGVNRPQTFERVPVVRGILFKPRHVFRFAIIRIRPLREVSAEHATFGTLLGCVEIIEPTVTRAALAGLLGRSGLHAE